MADEQTIEPPVQTTDDQGGNPQQPLLPADKRQELHGIVTKMILNKEPEENIKLVIDHYIQKNTPTVSINQSNGPTGTVIPAYAPATSKPASDIQGPKISVQAPKVMGTAGGFGTNITIPTVQDQHQIQVNDANQRVQKELRQIDPAVKSLLLDYKKQHSLATFQDQLQQQGGDMAANNQALQNAQHLLPTAAIKVSDDEVKGYKDAMQKDPALVREALYQQAKLHPDKAKKIASDVYLLDSEQRKGGTNTEQILNNAVGIEKGDLQYPIWHGGNVVKPLNTVESFVHGFQQRESQFQDYNLIADGSPEEVMAEMERRRNTPANPDTPIPVHNGLGGEFGNWVGSEGITMVKGAIPSLLAAGTGGSAEVVAPWVGAALTSPDFYKRGYANSFNQNYNDLRNEGKSPQDAYKIANDRAAFDAKADVALGAVMTATGGKLGMNAAETNFSPGFMGATKVIAKKIGESIPEASALGIAGGSVQVLKNLNSDKPLSKDVAEAVLTPIALHYAISVIAGGAKLVHPDLYKSAVDNMAKQPEDAVNKTIGEKVESGEITPEQANDTHLIIEDKRAQHEDLLNKAKDIVAKGKIEGFSAEPLQHAALNNPDEFASHLQNIAEQGHDPKTAEHTNEVYGQDLVNVAKQLYPHEDIQELIKSNRQQDLKEVDDEIKKLNPESTDYAGKKKELIDRKNSINDYYDNYGKHQEAINSPKIDNNETDQTGQSNAQTGQAEEVTNKSAAPQEPAPISNQQKEAAAGFLKQGIENGTIDKEYAGMEQHPEHVLNFIKEQLAAGKEADLEKEFGKDLVQLAKSESSYPVVRNIKLKDNAIPEQSAGGEIPRPTSAGENIPESGQGMGSSEQGTQTPGTQPETKNQGEGEINTVGVSHGSLKTLADKLGLEQPERGEVLTPEQYVQRGRELLKGGANPDDVAEDFYKTGKVSADAISVARAHFENLVKDTKDAYEKSGADSDAYKAAKQKADDWQRDVVKPMGTSSGAAFRSLQGETDIDTGSFYGMGRSFENENGRPMTEAEAVTAKQHIEKIAEQEKKIADLERQLSEAHDKNESSPEAKSIKAKAKKAAEWIRKGKSAPPGSFSAATPASLVWDGAVETAAKIIETSGSVAQAIADGIEHIKGSDWYKGLSKDKQQQAEQDFENHINANNPDIIQRFANKTDNKFNPKDAKDVWEYAKEKYLDKGSGYTEMINNTSKDLGLSPEQVRNAITQPKGTKVISDEIYIQNSKRNDAINEAKQWVKASKDSALLKFGKMVPNFFFGLKVFGHGTVGMVTHAGTNIFRPTSWDIYWKNFGRQFDYAFGGTTKKGLARYTKAMEDLKNHPDFIFWKRAGLAVDPKEIYDEYQGANKIFGQLSKPIGKLNKFIKKTSAIGDRGFNALKMYRMDMAKRLYDGLSDVEKADPETAKEIAKIVNHSTGTSEVKLPGIANTVFFAPKLEAARWQGLVTDPAKAVKTFVGWNKATPAEKVQAKIVARKAGEIAGTWALGLTINQGLLMAAGSKQRINFTDPSSSDWLKFKAGDKTLDVSGGMEATMKFIASLLNEAKVAYTGSKKDLKEKPGDKNSKTIATQLRYKLSPFASTIVDFATGTDAMGRPLPGSKVPPKKGETPHTWLSYVGEQQLPIPIAEGIKGTVESMKEKGMTNVQIKDLLTGIAEGVISGGTGAKVGKDYSLEPKPESSMGGKKRGSKREKRR